MTDPEVSAQADSPPTYSASRITMTATNSEFLMTVGTSRVAIDKRTGIPQATPGVEWLATYALSPVVAKQLILLLTQAVTAYEAQTKTKIPDSPLAKPN